MLQQSFGLPQPILEKITLPRDFGVKSSGPESAAEKEALLETLLSFRIPVPTQWGTGSAKGLNDLYKELVDGECTLLAAGRTLVREFRVARVDVFHMTDDGQLLRLKEDRQIFNDGRTRFRGFEYAIGEKAKPLERFHEAAHRGLSEELKIHDPLELLPINSFVDMEPPKDYPGIPSISKRADYRLILPPDYYRAEGYVDEQTDKKTVFIWVPSPLRQLPDARPNKLLSF